MNLHLPKVIGHRGIKNIAPENTLESVIKAANLGFKWIEIDVKVSKDNIPFLLHDDTLNRTTSGKGYPYNFNYNYISSLDAGIWFSEEFKSAYPPNLEEVLLFCSQNNIGVNIELKPNKNFEMQNVDSIVKLFSNSKLNCNYFFSSFDYFSAINLKKLLPHAFVGILINEFSTNNNIKEIVKTCLINKFFSCGLSNKIISNEVVSELKKNNLKVTAFSSNNISFDEANKLWDLGVDSVFVDSALGFEEILIN